MLRQDRIRQRCLDEKVDVFLATNPINMRYLSGFTGSGMVWIGENSNRIITDFRFLEQVEQESPSWELVRFEQKIEEQLAELIKKDNIKTVAFEAEHLSVDRFRQWQEAFPVELIPTTGWVEELRMVKTEEEIALIAQAAKIADDAFAKLFPQIKVGMTEWDIALELEVLMLKAGASGVSFPGIVASGPQGALPHAIPGSNQLKAGHFVVMDFGCIYQGYCSDMTRTFVLGEPSDKHKEIYDIVLRAQMQSLAAIAVDKLGKEVDQVARDIITDAGYGEYFGHGLGHGVGLQVHEAPRLSKVGNIPLKPGMVVTVEPGIYLPGWGGVRIEDLVVVKEEGVDILSKTSKELMIVE